MTDAPAARGYYFDELEPGMAHEITETVTEDRIERFAEVSGDRNPLHMDEAFASGTVFGQRIAHGALSASFISAILGNNLPGPGAIFSELNMRFRRPVFIGSEVTARAEVKEMNPRGNRVTMAIRCMVDGKVVISGEAKVVVPERPADADADADADAG